MDNIRHTFVLGLRFQTEVQYRVKGTHGPLLQKLPTTPPRMAADVRPSALLLLDTDLDEPWACGHNIRMELQREAGKGWDTDAPEALVCRSMASAASSLRLLELLIFPKLQ